MSVSETQKDEIDAPVNTFDEASYNNIGPVTNNINTTNNYFN